MTYYCACFLCSIINKGTLDDQNQVEYQKYENQTRSTPKCQYKPIFSTISLFLPFHIQTTARIEHYDEQKDNPEKHVETVKPVMKRTGAKRFGAWNSSVLTIPAFIR